MKMNFDIPSGEVVQEKFTEDEAYFAQKYSTQKEGKNISEQAESYDEAEHLLAELAERGVERLDFDWKSIDLKNPAQQEMLGERLSKEVVELAKSSTQEKGFLEKINDAVNSSGLKRVVSLLSLFSALYVAKAEAANINMSFGQAEKPRPVENYQRQEKVSTQSFKFGNSIIAFQYDQQGKAVSFNLKSERVFDQGTRAQLESVISKMMYSNIDENLTRAHIEKGMIAKPSIVKNNLKLVCMNLLENAGIYRNLMEMSKFSEARLIRENMSKTMNEQENLHGMKIFDRDLIRGILDSTAKN